ncbi:MAG TPA: hypothetical protein VIJ93_03415, partial [bacterium]
AYANGNVKEMAEVAGVHRNTGIVHFRDSFRIKSTLHLRLMWKKIFKMNFSFPDKVKLLYDRAGIKPRFSKDENRGLVNLWLMRIPRHVVRAHNVLFYLRKGLSLDAISKRFGKSGRDIHRYRVYGARPASQKWLAPLKPTKDEWLRKGWGGRKKRSGKQIEPPRAPRRLLPRRTQSKEKAI